VLAIIIGLSEFEVVSWPFGIDRTIVAIAGGVAATAAGVWGIGH
jgi:hypothetical protein